MPKYRAQITIEFETTTDLPTVSAAGSIAEIGNLMDNMPNPADLDDATSTASISVERLD
jgi:hypothetical protein